MKRSTIFAATLGLTACAISPQALSRDAVNVSSLAGLQSAINNAPSDGRTITLARGVYDQRRPIRINGQSNITIRGETDDAADTVIQGPGINDDSLNINVRLNNADHATLTDLTLSDSYYHAVQVNNDSDDFTADNIYTIDNGESGFKVTSPVNGSGASAYSDNGRIINSRIGFTEAGQRSVVEGVDLVAVKNWMIRANEFKNIRSADGSPAYAAFAKGNSKNVFFVDNKVADSFIGLSFGGGGTGRQFFRNGNTRVETRGGLIGGNRIDDTTDVGIYVNQAEDYMIIGNTVTDSGQATGSINIRYPESNGVIRSNWTSGAIRLRDGAHARRRNNSRISGTGYDHFLDSLFPERA